MDFNTTLRLLEKDIKIPHCAELMRKSAEDLLKGKKTKDEVLKLELDKGVSKQSILDGLKFWGIK